MKIKKYAHNIVAMMMVAALVSGFQLENGNKTADSLNSILGIEEAYAGPCNDNGCIGGSDRCMEVSILWGAVKRTCWTTVAPQQLPPAE